MMTPQVLRALTLGLRELLKGDDRDHEEARLVAEQVYKDWNLAWDGRGFRQPQDITRGFFKGPRGPEEAWRDVGGQWRWQAGRLTPGTEIYLDEFCRLLVLIAVDRT